MAIRVNISGGSNPSVRLGVSQNDFTLSREAEAWAVGTRNGVAVAAGDPAYHNNAKYYADNAQPVDDTAGIGDTGKVWSADKSANEVGTLKSALDYNEECAKLGLIPYGCVGESQGSTLVVSQNGNEIVINGTSNATVGQSATKILITDHTQGWNASTTPESAFVFPLKLISGRAYKLKASILSGTRDAGEGAGNITIRIIASPNLDILNEVVIGIGETENESIYLAKDDQVQIRVYISRLITCTDLKVRIELQDATDQYLTAQLQQEQAEFVLDEFGLTKYIFKYNDNKAINTSDDVVNIDEDTLEQPTNAPWKYCIIPCQAGDKFHVNIDSGTSTYRPYAFLRSDGTKISTASVNVINIDLVAPENAAYLVCNVLATDGAVYVVTKGENKIEKRMLDSIHQLTGVTFATYQQGGIALGSVGDVVTPVPNASTTALQNYACCIMPIKGGDTLKYSMYNGSTTYRNWAFLDENYVILQKAPIANYGGERTLRACPGSAYVVMNTSNRTMFDYWAIVIPASENELPWNGLYVSLLGDSISALSGYVPSGNAPYYPKSHSDVSAPEDMWWYQVITALGGTPLIIDAWSGSCITKGVRTSVDDDGEVTERTPMCDTSRCQRLHAYVQTTQDDESDGVIQLTNENIGTIRTSPFLPSYTPAVGDYVKPVNPDIVIIAGGTNDWTYMENASDIGTYDGHTEFPNPSDESTVAVTTFREAYATLLCRLHIKYKSALAICCTGFFTRRPYITNYQTNRNTDSGLTMQDFNEAIREIAGLYTSPIVDLYCSGLNRYNYYDTFAQDRASSTTHPNKAGHRVIAKNTIPQFKAACAGFVAWIRDQKAEEA